MGTVATIIIVVVTLILLFILAIVLNVIYVKNRQKKMITTVENFFMEYVKNHDKCKIEKVFNDVYDYKLTTPLTVNYIKIVPNLSCDEITINNSVAWQIKKSFNDEKNRFVPNIESFMNYEITKFEPKEIKDNEEIKPKKKKKKTDEERNLFNQDKELTFSDLDLGVFDEEKSNYKTNRKIFLIYPNSRLLLMYINECEMKFVTPKTDINGANVINFLDLKENTDSLIY